MTTVPTSQLQGAALDWAVAKCEGVRTVLARYEHTLTGVCVLDAELVEMGADGTQELRYSRDWVQGGPIIERERIDIQSKFSGSSIVPKDQWYWQASTVTEDDVAYWLDGHTPLVAAMRCYVASKLGDDVAVPEGLT